MKHSTNRNIEKRLEGSLIDVLVIVLDVQIFANLVRFDRVLAREIGHQHSEVVCMINQPFHERSSDG